MEYGDSLGYLSLVWLICTFMFIEVDRRIESLRLRLSYSLSIDENGAIDLRQLAAKNSMGLTEMLSLFDYVNESVPIAKARKNNVNIFREIYQRFNLLRKQVWIHLFALTILVIASNLFQIGVYFNYFVKIYSFFSLCIPYFYFNEASELENVRFVWFKPNG